MGQLLFQTTPPLEKWKTILDHTKKWTFPAEIAIDVYGQVLENW